MLKQWFVFLLKYLSETVKIEKQVGRPANASPLYRKTGVKAYFKTADGYTYISTGNITGFVPLNILSDKKIVDLLLKSIKLPALITFDTKKSIGKTHIAQYGTYGNYSVQEPNIWKGTMHYDEGEISSSETGTISMTISGNKIDYSIDESKLTIPFPLPIDSKIAVNGRLIPVEKMLERYTHPHNKLSGNTLKM